MRNYFIAFLIGIPIGTSACSNSECTASLQACEGCPTSEVAARAMSVDWCRGGIASAVAGTCGEIRYVGFGGLSGGPTMYYDSEGNLVGVFESNDVPSFCDESFTIEYGRVPDCTRNPEIDLCAGEAL